MLTQLQLIIPMCEYAQTRMPLGTLGHTNYRQLLTTTDNSQTKNTIYRQQTRNSEAPTKCRHVLFTDKYRQHDRQTLTETSDKYHLPTTKEFV